MRLDQSFREGQSALNLFRIFAPNSGMIAEWPAVASRDHEVHEVCLAAEHAESQSLPPENCRTRCRRCKRIFLPTEHSREIFFSRLPHSLSRFKSRLSSSNRSTSSWLSVHIACANDSSCRRDVDMFRVMLCLLGRARALRFPSRLVRYTLPRRRPNLLPRSAPPLLPRASRLLHAVVLRMKMAVALVGRRPMDPFAIARAALAAHVIAHLLTIVPMGTTAFPS